MKKVLAEDVQFAIKNKHLKDQKNTTQANTFGWNKMADNGSGIGEGADFRKLKFDSSRNPALLPILCYQQPFFQSKLNLKQ